MRYRKEQREREETEGCLFHEGAGLGIGVEITPWRLSYQFDSSGKFALREAESLRIFRANRALATGREKIR